MAWWPELLSSHVTCCLSEFVKDNENGQQASGKKSSKQGLKTPSCALLLLISFCHELILTLSSSIMLCKKLLSHILFSR